MTQSSAAPSRRAAMQRLGWGALLASAAGRSAPAAAKLSNDGLEELKRKLAAAPRRRRFETVPLVVTSLEQWDHEAAAAVLGYRASCLQVWECTEVGAPWLNLMREAINGQVFAHSNPGFLAVAAVHGSAHLALFDQAAWDTHNLARLTGDVAASNTYLASKAGTSPSDDLQDVAGYYGPENNNIQTLQERCAVFIACHDSIHAIARTVHQRAAGPGSCADAIAADLTNHLVGGAVLVPSVVAFLVELQRRGFTYAKGA